MAYDFSKFKTSLREREDWLKKELGSVRTGRANPAILDGVRVESYGALMPISQVAGVNIEGPRSIRITPWDMSQAKNIEKAIIVSNLGLSVSVDDQGLRVSFPELTSETRATYVKMANQKVEEARVAVRGERDMVWDDIQAKAKGSAITEDDKFRHKDEMQKLVDETNKKLEEMGEKKEKEILS